MLVLVYGVSQVTKDEKEEEDVEWWKCRKSRHEWSSLYDVILPRYSSMIVVNCLQDRIICRTSKAALQFFIHVHRYMECMIWFLEDDSIYRNQKPLKRGCKTLRKYKGQKTPRRKKYKGRKDIKNSVSISIFLLIRYWWSISLVVDNTTLLYVTYVVSQLARISQLI